MINSTDTDLIAVVNGTEYMVPNMIMVNRNSDVSIHCSKVGYHPYRKVIGHHFNLTGTMDLVSTFFLVVPVIGLFTPGIWSLNATEVNIDLHPKNY